MDDYIFGLTLADLRARNVSSHKEYKYIVNQNCINVPIDLGNSINIANNILMNNNLFDYSNFRDYPWKISCTINNVIENGYPFTLSDVIYLPIDILYKDLYGKDFIRLLIHERIHIFQRFFPEIVNQYIYSKGYVLYRHVNRSTVDYLLRSNPDIDNFIYLLDGITSGSYYKSSNPKGIDDSYCKLKYEHPYEHMAYEISELLTQ